MTKYPIRDQLANSDVKSESIFPESFQTKRLRFVGPISNYDFSEFLNFASGDSWSKMVKYNYLEDNTSAKYLKDQFWSYAIESWKNGEGAYYMIELRDEHPNDYNHPFIGWAAIEFDWDFNKAEIGISLHPEFWGNGYSSERAKALIDLGFWYDTINVVEACPAPENENSVHAVNKYMSKLGGEKIGTIKNYHKIDGFGLCDAVLFQVTESDFEESLDN